MLDFLLIFAQAEAVSTAAPSQQSTNSFAAFVTEASARFGIPAAWIIAVMSAESANKRHATSTKGAMGLMQIMPGTWQVLRTKYALGDDPYDPRNNILAGAAYLREMFDRYGAHGFLAAYNAGPGRYEASLKPGGTLPLETISYVAKIAPIIGVDTNVRLTLMPLTKPIFWTEAPLFSTTADQSNELPFLLAVPVPSSPVKAIFPDLDSEPLSKSTQPDQEN